MEDDTPDFNALLGGVRRGDQTAARKLVAALFPLVQRIVRCHLPRRVAEEDLAQEVFMKIFTRLEQYRGEMPLTHWVSRIAVTTCIDQLRKQKVRPELRWADLSEKEAEVLDNVLTSSEVDDVPGSIAARELVGRLLEQLSPADRAVITMLDLEQKSVAEIKNLTGWGTSMIKVRAYRARRKLRKLLEQLEQKERK
jgi:RNA polymerase sigma-70 factor (ECF subfamily)